MRAMSSRGKLLAFGIALGCAFGPAAPDASADADGHVPEVATGVTMLEHPERPVVGYTLRAKLEPVAHTVHGEGTLRWTNTSTKPVSELWFHLYLNGFKNQSSVFMRAPVGGFRGSTIPHEWGTIDVARLSLADGAQSNALMFVDGLEAADGGERRSTVTASLVMPGTFAAPAAFGPWTQTEFLALSGMYGLVAEPCAPKATVLVQAT